MYLLNTIFSKRGAKKNDFLSPKNIYNQSYPLQLRILTIKTISHSRILKQQNSLNQRDTSIRTSVRRISQYPVQHGIELCRSDSSQRSVQEQKKRLKIRGRSPAESHGWRQRKEKRNARHERVVSLEALRGSRCRRIGGSLGFLTQSAVSRI